MMSSIHPPGGSPSIKGYPRHVAHDTATPLTLSTVLSRRACVRDFAPTPIPAGTLEAALHLAQRAPSAGNLQAYRVVIVTDAAVRREMGIAANDQPWIASAPAILVFLADPPASAVKYGARGASLYAVQDATILAAYTALALEAAGVSSCWVGAFDEVEVAALVGVGQRPGDPLPGEDGALVPVVVMPVGYPRGGGGHHRTPREPLASRVTMGAV